MKLGLIAVFLLQTLTTTVAQQAPPWAQQPAPSPVWKEYVYEESGFAITLPEDPHPHKSAVVREGTAYRVPLSKGVFFSLHATKADPKCDAVREQSEKYEKNKDAPQPEGFKSISFREVSGTGYSGIEFVQQVPNGRIDYERWICGGNRLYIFTSGWSPDEPEPKELRRIVDSFRVTPTK